jgi:hypothetical protein
MIAAKKNKTLRNKLNKGSESPLQWKLQTTEERNQRSL